LTPENMAQALQTTLGQQQINRQALSDSIDAQYKAGLLGNYAQQAYDRQVAVNQRQTEFDREFNRKKNAISSDPYTAAIQTGYKGTRLQWAEKMAELQRNEEAPKTPTSLSVSSALRSLEDQFGKRSADGQFYIAPELQDAGNYAFKKFNDYIKISPNDPMGARNKAYRNSQDYRVGVGELKQFITANPENTKAHLKNFKRIFGYLPEGYR